MADNVTTNSGSGGATIAADDISSVHYPRTKVTLGADGVNDGDVSSSNPMPVMGTGTAGTANANVLTVQGIASMTPIQVGDNSGSLTVDNAGTFAVQVDGAALTALQLIDDAVYTGGTGTPSKGLAVMGTDGTNPQLIVTDTTGHLQIDVLTLPNVTIGAALPAGTNNIGDVDVLTVPAPLNVTGGGVEASALRVTIASDSTGVVSVDDNGSSLTIDNAALSVTGGGVEASALRVTIASDSTGVLSVDDNGGSLTVDGTVAATQSGTWTVGLSAGTNNIGDVDVLTQPARAATTDTITAKLATDTIQDGTTALTPKFASIDVATSGDNTIVAAVASKKIRVLEYAIVCAAATTVIWKSATAGAITGDMSFAANGGIATPFSPLGKFETTAGEALVLNLSAANAVSGHLVYVEA